MILVEFPSEAYDRVGYPRMGPKDSFVRVSEIHHELSAQINAFSDEVAIGDLRKIVWRNQPTHRHFAGRISFPVSTTSRRSQGSAIGQKRLGRRSCFPPGGVKATCGDGLVVAGGAAENFGRGGAVAPVVLVEAS